MATDGAAGVLVRTRELLRARGWVASNDAREPHGPPFGPLTLSQAIWRAVLDDHAVPVRFCSVVTASRQSVGNRLDAELGAWARQPGRTEAEVLALFDAVLAEGDRRVLAAVLGVRE